MYYDAFLFVGTLGYDEFWYSNSSAVLVYQRNGSRWDLVDIVSPLRRESNARLAM
jgi:hypothetical protein